jgi:membrane protease YdiL (CAAX protease family)
MEAYLTILVLIICMILYTLIYVSKSFSLFFFKGKGHDHQIIGKVLLEKFSGFLLFGIIPVIFMLISGKELNKYGLGFDNITSTLLIAFVLSAAIIVANIFFAKSPNNLEMYPQIRVNNWSLGLLFSSALGWILYLLAYEIMFRGVLLFTAFYAWGYWPAIIINVIIYSIVHIPKGKKETFGAIPLGFVLCIICLEYGNFWAAFIIHIAMALSNEWFSIKYHPEMKVRFSKNQIA